MNTPSPKYFCPRCRAAFDVDSNYCGRCGADMHRASRLQHAMLVDESSGPVRSQPRTTGAPGPSPRHNRSRPATESGAPRDRRASTAYDPWLGRLVDGRYRVNDVLGRGGMGVVYKVEHQRMGKIAAMKVLHRELARDSEVIARFQREAETVSQLTHPNTVQVFDFGTAQGAMYLVMEYVRGLDLGTLIDRDGPMAFERAAPLLGQICAALAEAHELGVVHRDLKPENILVTRTHDGTDFVKVLDFGLAKLVEREESSSTTNHDSIVGTPYYMSPEQIRGEHKVDGRSDVYSLGALMYRILTGEPAFPAATPVGVLTKHLTEEVEPPSASAPDLDIPATVDAIVVKAMAKSPADRYQSVGALSKDIEAAFAELTGASVSGRRPLGWRPPSDRIPSASAAIDIEPVDSSRHLRRSDIDAFERSLKRRRILIGLLLPTLLVAGAAGTYYFMIWRAKQPKLHEVESNNSIADATLIASNKAVSGYLGKRISKSESDRDFYRLTTRPDPAGGDQVTVTVTAPPNIDLALSLYDAGGTLITTRNERGIGQPEALHNVRVRQPVVIEVSERLAPGALPTENVSDRYRLTATLDAIDPGSESEPNDSRSDANSVTGPARIRGWLERQQDVDLFRFTGPSGSYRISIDTPGQVPYRLSVAGAVVESPHTRSLNSGDMIEIARADRATDQSEVGYQLVIETAAP